MITAPNANRHRVAVSSTRCSSGGATRRLAGRLDAAACLGAAEPFGAGERFDVASRLEAAAGCRRPGRLAAAIYRSLTSARKCSPRASKSGYWS